MGKEAFLTGLLWIIWCFSHSFLISKMVTDWVSSQVWQRFFRLFYVIVSMSTFLPVFMVTILIEQKVLFQWTGWWRIFQVFLLGYSLYFFIGGASVYDAKEFLGLSQVRQKKTYDKQVNVSSLRTNGILKVVRHPWYSGGFAFLWCIGPFTNVNLLARIILSLYLLVGAMLEERKLLRLYSDRYRRYQQDVPMLLPWKNWFF